MEKRGIQTKAENERGGRKSRERGGGGPLGEEQKGEE
jgi:hypothetical protein